MEAAKGIIHVSTNTFNGVIREIWGDPKQLPWCLSFPFNDMKPDHGKRSRPSLKGHVPAVPPRMTFDGKKKLFFGSNYGMIMQARLKKIPYYLRRRNTRASRTGYHQMMWVDYAAFSLLTSLVHGIMRTLSCVPGLPFFLSACQLKMKRKFIKDTKAPPS